MRIDLGSRGIRTALAAALTAVALAGARRLRRQRQELVVARARARLGRARARPRASPPPPRRSAALGNGQKATGQPIKLGGIATKQPGTDFTDIPNMAKAYFDCVNDNGGINGRPIHYMHRDRADRPRPGRVAGRKLIQSEKVLGIVGNT